MIMSGSQMEDDGHDDDLCVCRHTYLPTYLPTYLEVLRRVPQWRERYLLTQWVNARHLPLYEMDACRGQQRTKARGYFILLLCYERRGTEDDELYIHLCHE